MRRSLVVELVEGALGRASEMNVMGVIVAAHERERREVVSDDFGKSRHNGIATESSRSCDHWMLM
jgi:hypothetical protein